MKKITSFLLMFILLMSVSLVLAVQQSFEGESVNIQVNDLDFGFFWGAETSAKETVFSVTPQRALPPQESQYSITDDSGGFGDESTILLEKDVDATLDELFAGDGFSYTYTVLAGNGAAPIVAVFELNDERNVILFPGWGPRTGEHTLTFSDDVAEDTGGNNAVDFTIYSSDFSSNEWSNGGSYPAWTDTKGLSDCPLDGTEEVKRVFFMHQGAGTGQEDRLESTRIDGGTYYLSGGLGLYISKIEVTDNEDSAVRFRLNDSIAWKSGTDVIGDGIFLNPLNEETLLVKLFSVTADDPTGTITYTISEEFEGTE